MTIRLSRFAGIAAVVLLASAAGGCSPSLRTSSLAYGDAVGVYTNGNLRLVTGRSRVQPVSGRVLPTVCTEPTPDHAIAVDQAGAIAANITKLGSGAATFDSAEVATELPGRTPGVLALRDGLYAACQSYVNGVIGHDAYALILSQYSDLMIELIHAQEETLSAATAHTAKPEPPKGVDPNPLAGAGGANVQFDSPVRAAVLDDAAMARATGGAMLAISQKDPPIKNITAPAAAFNVEREKTKEALHAAILVACLNEHDPTRIGGEGGQPKNAMLTRDYCRHFLERAVGTSAKRIVKLSAR